MYQNTKPLFTRGLFKAALLSMLLLSIGNSHASPGTELAKEMLQKIRTVSTEQGLNELLQKAAQEKSRLSSQDRIDYVEYLFRLLASSVGTDRDELSIFVMRLVPDGISEQEISAGEARLLSSNDLAVRKFGENLASAGNVKLPNGEMGQDISVFDLALHDPKVPKEPLIKAIFKIAPVETAQWLADHSGLSADERAGLEFDLQKAWKLHRAINDSHADKQTLEALDDSVKYPLLDRWLHSPSWILRSLANGLLEKHQEWQMPDLKKAMQPVEVPAGLQLSSTSAQPASK